MSTKKFFGKIQGEPWVALSKGPREVMASLWREYLTEILEVSGNSGRFRLLKREIDKAAGFREIFQDWNSLSPEARAESWRRLAAAARERAGAVRESCVGCGEGCELGSPTLPTWDLDLCHREVLTWNEVYTLRAGEAITSREGAPAILKEECLKVREVPIVPPSFQPCRQCGI